MRATLRKSFPPTSCRSAARFLALQAALSGETTIVPVTRMEGEVYVLGSYIVRGRGAARRKYRTILQKVLQEFFPAKVVQELIENKKIDELEATDVRV